MKSNCNKKSIIDHVCKSNYNSKSNEQRLSILSKMDLIPFNKYIIGKINQKNTFLCKFNNMYFQKTFKNNLVKISSFNIKYANNDIITDKNYLNPKSIYSHDLAEDEIKLINNPYLNKSDIIKQDKQQKEKYNQTVSIYLENLDNHKMENLEIHDILDIISKMLNSENHNPDLWYKLLNQFNELLCSHRIGKKDIINFLELLNFFKPKILEKKILPKETTQIGSQILFSKKHEEEYYKLTQPRDIFGQFALHLKKNLNSNVVSKMFDSKPKFENRENINENLDDLIGLYSTLFKNIEQKIVDDIRCGRANYTYKDSVTLIKSFSCAQEGSNMFYELQMRKVIKHFNELDLEDIEIILNYLPHELYDNKEFSLGSINENIVDKENNEKENNNINSEEKYVEMGRTKSVSEFYKNAYERVLELIPQADNSLFLNLFQGCLKIKFVDVDIIGAFLLEFDKRLNADVKKEKDEENSNLRKEKAGLNKKFVLDFLQILTYFIRNDFDEKFKEVIDFEILWKAIYDNFLLKNIENFTLKEISTIFWVMFHFNGVTVKKILFFEEKIKKILLGYINDPKSKIDTMGYETSLRYYDNYDIDPYDIDALKFFIEGNKNYKGDLLRLFAKAIKCIKLENTHPISRGLFNFW